MHIGILSDTHNRTEMVKQALQVLDSRGIRTVLHCGDIESPAIVALFAGWDAHFVLGNCDYNRELLQEAMEKAGVTFHDSYGSLELEGCKIAFLHGHQSWLMKDVESCGHYDFLFYGHTHIAREHQAGPTRVINPGALHRARPKTFLILDLTARTTETVVLAEET